jgi:hypothetical protein
MAPEQLLRIRKLNREKKLGSQTHEAENSYRDVTQQNRPNRYIISSTEMKRTNFSSKLKQDPYNYKWHRPPFLI